MFIVRAILASLVLVECLASARYVGLGSGDSFVNDWHEVFADIQPRQSSSSDGASCRRICGSCGSSCSSTSVSKRDFIDLATSDGTFLDEYSAGNDTHHLLKRTLQNVRQSSIGSFLKRKTDALVSIRDNPNSNLISLAYSTSQNDYTCAVLRKFSDFSTNVLNIGIAGLEGCTALTVVSPKAVYMGHFFESLAFRPDGNINPDTAFQQNCLNLITGQGQQWRTRGDSLDPSQFTGENGPAIAFIMTPRQDQDDPTEDNPNPPVPGPETQLFEARIKQLSNTLTDLIPGVTIVYYNYIATNIEDYTAAYQGKALFEYDPNADSANNANFRIWYEQTSEDGHSLGLFD